MARLWWDGFEYNSLVVLNFLYTNTTDNLATAVYTGSGGLKVYTAQKAIRTLDAAKSELCIKFHLRVASLSGSYAICGFYKGTTCIGWLQRVDRTLKFFSGTGTGTQLGSTTGDVLSALTSDWNLIEVRLKLSDTVGVAQVRVNEALVIDSGECDTMPTADADMDKIYLGASGGANAGSGDHYDDFIVDDADWPGNRRVYKVQPTGAGTATDWDPSTGANYACVDEIPYSDADFVSTNTADEIDTYACSDLPGDATSAKGLMVIVRAKEEGSATPQNIQVACRTESTNYFGDSYAPPSGSAGFTLQLWPTNPNTGVDWTVAQINAVEIGVKAVA